MRRKVNEIFEDGYGNKVIVKQSDIEYPTKCLFCCYFSQEYGCQGVLEETGDCRPYFDEDMETNYIFEKLC